MRLPEQQASSQYTPTDFKKPQTTPPSPDIDNEGVGDDVHDVAIVVATRSLKGSNANRQKCHGRSATRLGMKTVKWGLGDHDDSISMVAMGQNTSIPLSKLRRTGACNIHFFERFVKPLKALDSDRSFIPVSMAGSMCFRPIFDPQNTDLVAAKTKLDGHNRFVLPPVVTFPACSPPTQLKDSVASLL